MNRTALFDLNLVRAFDVVAECGSFTAAADQLHVTQSTVSQQIRRLESRVGKPLFHRNTRRVTLTEDGEMLRGYAVSLLQTAEDATTRLTAPEVEGQLSIGTSDDLALHVLPGLLRRFRRLYHRVRLDVRIGLTANLFAQMESGDLDLVLGKSLPGNSGARMVGKDRLVWVGDPDLVARPDRPVALALFPAACVYREAATKALRRHGRLWETAYTSPSLTGIYAAIEAGLAISPLPICFANELHILKGGIGNLPALPQVEFALFADPKTERLPAAQQFIALVEPALNTLLSSRNRQCESRSESGQRNRSDGLTVAE